MLNASLIQFPMMNPEEQFQMQRVMIIGGPGSGKSTLALKMSGKTGLPVFHMDHLHWLADWEQRPSAEKVQMAKEIENRTSWIFEGGLSATYSHRLKRAETVVWLDLPVMLRFSRVVKRTFRDHGKHRADMAEGCREGFHKETLPFWIWIWRTRKTQREKIAKLLAGNEAKTIIHCQSSKDVANFLAELDVVSSNVRQS